MQKNANYFIVNPNDIEEYFGDSNPFSYRSEFKKYKNAFIGLNDNQVFGLLAQEIKESYIKSKPGDFIYHVNGKFHIAILKTRIADVNNNKGKSGGWRIIALVDENQGIIYALSIYMHSNGKDNLTKTEDRLVKKLCDKYYKENY